MREHTTSASDCTIVFAGDPKQYKLSDPIAWKRFCDIHDQITRSRSIVNAHDDLVAAPSITQNTENAKKSS